MRKQQAWVILAFLIALGGFLYYIFFFTPYPKYNWSETLRPQGKQPYDLDVFYDMLENIPGVEAEVNKGKPLRSIEFQKQYQAYLFINGGNPHYSEKDVENLTQFVRKGGRALFICPRLGENLSNALLKKEAETIIVLEAVNKGDSNAVSRKAPMGFYQFPLKSVPHYFFKGPDTLFPLTYPYFLMNAEWFYLKEEVKKIGFIGKDANFLEIPLGKGKILWHCNPLAFTNFHLLRPEMQEYAEVVMAQLNLSKADNSAKQKAESDTWFSLDWFSDKSNSKSGGNKILVDEASKFPIWSKDGKENTSPLVFILSQEAFQWAWYTLLAGVLTYLALLARRRQREIPLMPSRTNSTLHFIHAISELYVRQQSHYFMCQQKMKQFLNHIKTRYGISHQGLSADSVQILARRSGTNPELVKSIFQDWNYIQDYSMQNTTAEQLARFHFMTEQFYHQSK